MPLQSFLIAPLKSGVQTNKKPWLIADDAYELLRNVYCWRGRVKKRFGARVMDQSVTVNRQQELTRLRVKVGTTDALGDAIGFVPGNIFAIGQMFSIGSIYFTVNELGAPAALLSTNSLMVGTYNTVLGTYTFLNSVPLTDIYFYPAEPVMHIGIYQQLTVANEKTIVFDTQMSYEYVQGTGFQRLGAAPDLWTGSDSDFHWTTNWRGDESSDYFMFVVNNVAADGIRYWDGATWTVLAPPVTNAAGDTILTALIVEVFQGYLLLFNILEAITPGPTNLRYSNRVRWCQYGSPITVDAWRDDIDGLGSFQDAPTREAIISVKSLKDRLIVFFETSTYELVYTNNGMQPFKFQKLNSELGVESTHSTISFDKIILGMGSTGVHACNGLNVDRMDEDIPQTIFDINNVNNGPLRVHGIRDYYEELAYWTYPSKDESYEQNNVFPNRLLVMDYINGTWAFFDDSITTFGYYYLQDNYLVWQNINEPWQAMNMAWNYGIGENLFRSVLAGNQEGWMFIMTPDLSRNCMSLQVTDIAIDPQFIDLTVINHNISPASPYVFLRGMVSDGTLTALNNGIHEAVYIDENTLRIYVVGMTGTYFGGGTLERVSQIEILTKEYNFFPNVGERCFLAYADFYVDREARGQITVDYLSSTSTLSTLAQARLSGALLGTGILETSPYPTKPWEMTQAQFWHRMYFQQDGEVVQLRFYMSPAQIQSIESINNGFVINAIQYYAQPTSSYL